MSGLCSDCPGCGQFCEYPACLPGYVAPPPPPNPAEQVAEALAWAAQWAQRHADWERYAG